MQIDLNITYEGEFPIKEEIILRDLEASIKKISLFIDKQKCPVTQSLLNKINRITSCNIFWRGYIRFSNENCTELEAETFLIRSISRSQSSRQILRKLNTIFEEYSENRASLTRAFISLERREAFPCIVCKYISVIEKAYFFSKEKAYSNEVSSKQFHQFCLQKEEFFLPNEEETHQIVPQDLTGELVLSFQDMEPSFILAKIERCLKSFLACATQTPLAYRWTETKIKRWLVPL